MTEYYLRRVIPYGRGYFGYDQMRKVLGQEEYIFEPPEQEELEEIDVLDEPVLIEGRGYKDALWKYLTEGEGASLPLLMNTTYLFITQSLRGRRVKGTLITPCIPNNKSAIGRHTPDPSEISEYLLPDEWVPSEKQKARIRKIEQERLIQIRAQLAKENRLKEEEEARRKQTSFVEDIGNSEREMREEIQRRQRQREEKLSNMDSTERRFEMMFEEDEE